MSINDFAIDFEQSSGGADLLGDEAELKFRYVSPDDIEPDPAQPRKRGVESISDILADFSTEKGREIGIRTPVDVIDLGNGRFRLVNGERRWRAAKKAKLPKIPVMVQNYDESESGTVEKMIIQLKDNQQRQDVDPRDEGRIFLELANAGISNVDIANQMTEKDSNGKTKPMSVDKVRMLMDLASADLNPKLSFISELYDEPTVDHVHSKPYRDLKLLSNIYRAASKKDASKVKALVYALAKDDKLDRQVAAKLKNLDYKLSVKELKEVLFKKPFEKVKELESQADSSTSLDSEPVINGPEEKESLEKSDMSEFEKSPPKEASPEVKSSNRSIELPTTQEGGSSVIIRVIFESVLYVLLVDSKAKKKGEVVLQQEISGERLEVPLSEVEFDSFDLPMEESNSAGK